MPQVAVLERPSVDLASTGMLHDLAAQQRTGGRLRAWALASTGNGNSAVFALDEVPGASAAASGVRGAEVRLRGDYDMRPLIAASPAEVLLQVRIDTCSSLSITVFPCSPLVFTLQSERQWSMHPCSVRGKDAGP